MAWKIHNAMWPGLVGKEDGSDQPPISLEKMISMTSASEVNAGGYDGIDLFLYAPDLDIDASDEQIRRFADDVAARGLKIGTLVAPIWQDTGGGSAMGDQAARNRFVTAVNKACRWAQVLNDHGVRSYGSIRIDSATPVDEWAKQPAANTRLIAKTFRESGQVAADHGEVLVAEGEICWGGMHSWKDMLDLLEETGAPESVGFQADLAHTYLYLLGYNAEQHALINEPYNEDDFWSAYQTMADKLRPWTYDFHVAQNDGTVHGTCAHGTTGRHCMADDPNGRLDIMECAKYWLLDEAGKPRPEIQHLCWDGCLFPNSILEKQSTWDMILKTMQGINTEHTPI